MCLDVIYSKKEKNEWLRKQPSIITGYKIVSPNDTGIESVCMPEGSNKYLFKKINIIEEEVVFKYFSGIEQYRPYFHLFLNKVDAENWNIIKLREKYGGKSLILLKCEIPKRAITAIGEDNPGIAIITKEFTFIEGDKYFKEDK